MKKVWYAPNQFEAYGEEEILAVEHCLRDGWLAGFGPRTVAFEERIATQFGKKYGVFVNSGSAACLLALASLQLPKGTKIVTPACTFSTTLAPIIQLGLIPVFVDVDLTSYCANVEEVLAAIDGDVKALMIPNLIGNKPNWKALKKGLAEINREDIILIEDSADTVTHTPETDISTTSFYASHVITAGGAGKTALCTAFIAKHFGGAVGTEIINPLPTTTNPVHDKTQDPLGQRQLGGKRSKPGDKFHKNKSMRLTHKT